MQKFQFASGCALTFILGYELYILLELQVSVQLGYLVYVLKLLCNVSQLVKLLRSMHCVYLCPIFYYQLS
jgi:hypothetical protein